MQLKKIIKNIYLSVVYRVFKLFPICKGRVIFSSYYGRQYSGDPKALYQTLIENNYPKSIVWVINSDISEEISKHSTVVSRYSIFHLYYLATSEFRIDNCQESSLLNPRDEMTYIQTWHGTPIKKIAQDVPGNHMSDLKSDWLADAKSWDFLLCPSEQVATLLCNAFQIDSNKAMILGNPRNDILLKQDSNAVVN
ncbi:CDP-glycerol glycerophosphotransferase family protein, partial [Vibrio sp. F12]|uniref:CDP-glycerol glycerophosphotransferase family protein n=2 Tax=Vibrio TaxID=662 RepID=UPI0014833D0B